MPNLLLSQVFVRPLMPHRRTHCGPAFRWGVRCATGRAKTEEDHAAVDEDSDHLSTALNKAA